MSRVTVYTTIGGEAVLAGNLSVQNYGERATSDFLYDPEYMYARDTYDLSPTVRRAVGEFTTRQLPFFIQDAGPDRWGAHLVDRQFEAQKAGRHPDDLDCVLAASDRARQGALRFQDEDGNWLGDEAVPVHTELSDLLAAADAVAEDTDSFEAYAALLRTGTSALGGARAKASVTDDDGHLWIAKFPMAVDGWDVPVWEKTTIDLAARADIPVPDAKLVRVAGRYVLLTKRFDRDGEGRVPYLSMRTLLNNPDDGTRLPDYRDIATALRHFGGEDLPGLYRRVAFGVLVNNTDDHLRNLGVLRDGDAWRLGPMFDVNSEPDAGKQRHTSVAGRTTPVGMVEGLVELARHCRVSRKAALAELDDLRDRLAGWQDVAAANGAKPREVARFARELGMVQDTIFSRPAS